MLGTQDIVYSMCVIAICKILKFGMKIEKELRDREGRQSGPERCVFGSVLALFGQ